MPLSSGLQLAVILLCFGAANSLASPYRLLRSLPAVLYETGVAVTVALSFTPELVQSIGIVRQARRLRGIPTKGLRGMRGVAVPVLESALDRSLQLATSMDARGYGRRISVGLTSRRLAREPPWRAVAGRGRHLRRHRRRVALRSGTARSRRRRRALRGRSGRGGAPHGALALPPGPVATARVDGGRFGTRGAGHVGRPALSRCRDWTISSPLWRPAIPLLPVVGILVALPRRTEPVARARRARPVPAATRPLLRDPQDLSCLA
jgi:hypothetical protein